MIEIQISREPGRHSARVSPPHGSTAWTSPNSLSVFDLIAELRKLGCHTTDISDAFDATGADWRSAYDAEVLRQRMRAEGEPSA